MTQIPLDTCPFCSGHGSMTDLVDEDERRFWVREIECDNCGVTMRDGIGFNSYCELGKEEAERHVGQLVTAKWNRRALPEMEGDMPTDQEKLDLVEKLVAQRRKMKFDTDARVHHRQEATRLANEVASLRRQIAKAEKEYGEHDRDAQYHAEHEDEANKEINNILTLLDGEET